MGGMCIKAETTNTIRKNRVAPLPGVIDSFALNHNRDHGEILDELRSLGIIKVSLWKPAGVAFELNDGPVPRRPRNLPALSMEREKSSIVHRYNSQERKRKAGAKRQAILEGKGKMGREHKERRKTVLLRRDEMLTKKIKRTEAKLNGQKI